MNAYWSNKPVVRFHLVLALVFLSCGMSGCGSSNQQPVEKDSTTVPTPIENVRASLQTVAESGEINSGTELIKEELDKLKGTAGVDVDALQKELESLLTARGPEQIRAKANAMIAKLPK